MADSSTADAPVTADDPSLRRLALAPGLEIVELADGLLLATSNSTLRLDGGVAAVVRSRILPGLAEDRTRADLLEALADLPSQEIGRILDRLIGAGLLVELPGDGEAAPPAWTHLLSNSRLDRSRIASRLTQLTVLIVGHGKGVHEVHAALQSAGVEAATILDPVAPDPARTGELPARLAREDVAALVVGNDLVVTVVDNSLSALRVWVNQASLDSGVPTLHAALDGSTAFVGPMVVPGEGPCYLCWRMRALACADDFAAAMAREEALDAARRVDRQPRPSLPTLAPAIAAAVTRDVLALTLGVWQPRLPGHVLQIDGADGAERLHAVVPRPDCPACGKKVHPPRPAPSLDELVAEPRRESDFVRLATAVSPVCGLIRNFDRVPKEIDEPELPIIIRAELANTRFGAGEHAFVGCSGKGMDAQSAQTTAIGEALERHASLTWQPTQRTSAMRAELDAPSIDPRDLVLFAPHQYDVLPYAPYTDSTVLEWIPARSLVSGDEVWVPLLAAHLAYDAPHSAAHLFPATSNGFAAGPTLAFAVLNALYEVIERDAFLIAWAHRLVTPRYDARTVPDPVARSVAQAYARRGTRIDVHLLPTDADAAVAMAVGWSDRAPAALIGLGAGASSVAAARRAILEVGQVLPALRSRLRKPAVVARMRELAADPNGVRDLEDHDLLYADAEFAGGALSHLLQSPLRDWEDGMVDSEPDALARLVESLATAAGDVLYIDVTPPDVESFDIRVARAIVPGFQPIHFGAHEMRLGHDRLRRLPADLGLRPNPAGLDELNLTPHPLA